MDKEFFLMNEKFVKGEISEQEWNGYCTSLLDQLLVDNRDVLIRLKGAN